MSFRVPRMRFKKDSQTLLRSNSTTMGCTEAMKGVKEEHPPVVVYMLKTDVKIHT